MAAFYYPWYGNPQTDGAYRHWNHEVTRTDLHFPGGDDIGANFYPQLGCYSCNDPAVVAEHMRMLRQAGVTLVAASWWGPGTFEDAALPLLLDNAADAGLRVCIHLEPYYPDIHTVRAALAYLQEHYAAHRAYYRGSDGRPLVFIYDSYRLAPEQWRSLFSPQGGATIRGTPLDACCIGLWVNPADGAALLEGGFDGAYTYFASDGFSYGSTSRNWPGMAQWSRENGLEFIPCPGPGYVDTRIRPWNTGTTRGREDGAYYDRMWRAAIGAAPDCIAVTSFNEWHEGTQIEPAVPFACQSFSYLDYTPLAPDWYLARTRYWGGIFREVHAGKRDPAGFIEGMAPAVLQHLARGCLVVLLTPATPPYAEGAALKLTDGLLGSGNCRDGCWVGFEQAPCELRLDLGAERLVSRLRIRFLEDYAAWVFLPEQVDTSLGPARPGAASTVPPAAGAAYPPARSVEYVAEPARPHRVRFISVKAQHSGICPAWHQAAGEPAWLFLDEVVAE